MRSTSDLARRGCLETEISSFSPVMPAIYSAMTREASASFDWRSVPPQQRRGGFRGKLSRPNAGVPGDTKLATPCRLDVYDRQSQSGREIPVATTSCAVARQGRPRAKVPIGSQRALPFLRSHVSLIWAGVHTSSPVGAAILKALPVRPSGLPLPVPTSNQAAGPQA